MEDNKRNIILMVVLTLAIFIGYDFFYLRPKMEEAQKAWEAEQAEIAAAQALDPTLAPKADASSMVAEPVVAVPDAMKEAGHITIETPELTGRLSLRGARIDDLSLNNHKVSIDSDETIALLAPYGSNKAYYARFGWAASDPNAGFVPDETTAWTTNDKILTPDSPVTLQWTNGEGVTYKMQVAVDENFLFTVTQTVENKSGRALKFAPYGLISRKGTPVTSDMYILHEGPFGVMGDTFSEYSYDDFDDEPTVEQASTGGWLGITDKYWMTVLIPEQDASLSRSRLAKRNQNGSHSYQASFVEDWQDVAEGGSLTRTAMLYAGAKEVSVIDDYADKFNIELFDRAIDWGWFYFLTRPIFFLLELFFSMAGNFGVAIILLVIVLKLILFPLANRQYESMARMKEAQPKLKALQERYKDDRAKLQQEMMQLYKKEKINPLAGCLPLLPQVFIFFALYKVLYVTIDMRHQPFFGWIKDMSAPDPLTPLNLFGLIPWDPPSFIAIGVWPILMGLTMYLQQKMNPSTLDPTQQKVMNLMPIIFTFILANFSAGLVVYWTMNSLLSVLQQWVITRRVQASKS